MLLHQLLSPLHVIIVMMLGASAILITLCAPGAYGFHARLIVHAPISIRTTTALSSKGDFDGNDMIGGEAGFSSNNAEEGQALAKEFYQQVRLRQAEEALLCEQDDNDDEDVYFETLSEEEARFRNRNAFSKRREVRMGKDVIRRGGGESSASAGFFSGEGNNASVYSVPQPGRSMTTPSSSNNSKQAFDRAEAAIAVQAVIALALFTFYLNIGMSEGIDENMWNAINNNPIEQVLISPQKQVPKNTNPVQESVTSSIGRVWI